MKCGAVWEGALNRRHGEHQHLDAHPRLTVAERDGVPLTEGMSNPLSGAGTLDRLYLYDPNGNVRERTDPKGQKETLAYGMLERLTSRSWTRRSRESCQACWEPSAGTSTDMTRTGTD